MPKQNFAMIEYVAPYWVVKIRNHGSKVWVPICHPEKKIKIMNEFGDFESEQPAVWGFTSAQEAQDWIDTHLKVEVASEVVVDAYRQPSWWRALLQGKVDASAVEATWARSDHYVDEGPAKDPVRSNRGRQVKEVDSMKA